MSRLAAAAIFAVIMVGALCTAAPPTEGLSPSPTGMTPVKPVADGPAPVNHMEEPCLKQGGICLRADECPEGSLDPQRGLCPAQRDQGVECCHGLSVKERRCAARGGVCRPKRKCGRALWDQRADDCASEEVCCILV